MKAFAIARVSNFAQVKISMAFELNTRGKRCADCVYNLCVRRSLQAAMITAFLSRRLSAVVPCLANYSAIQLPSILRCTATQMRLILRWVATSFKDLHHAWESTGPESCLSVWEEKNVQVVSPSVSRWETVIPPLSKNCFSFLFYWRYFKSFKVGSKLFCRHVFGTPYTTSEFASIQ